MFPQDGKNNSQRPYWMQRKACPSPMTQALAPTAHLEDDEENGEADRVGGEEDTVYISNLQLPYAMQWAKVDVIGRKRPVIMDMLSPVATVQYSHAQRQKAQGNSAKPKKKKKKGYLGDADDSEKVYSVAASLMVLGKRDNNFRAKRLTILPATLTCAVRNSLHFENSRLIEST